MAFKGILKSFMTVVNRVLLGRQKLVTVSC